LKTRTRSAWTACLLPKAFPRAIDQDEDEDLAEAVRRMRAWIEDKEKSGPKLYVPEEESPRAQTILEKLNMTKEEFDAWDW
jgi:hypothetical protein